MVRSRSSAGTDDAGETACARLAAAHMGVGRGAGIERTGDGRDGSRGSDQRGSRSTRPRARQQLPTAVQGAAGGGGCPACAAAAALAQARSGCDAANARTAGHRRGGPAGAEAGRPAHPSEDLCGQPLFVRQQAVAAVGGRRQRAADRRVALPVVAGRSELVARPTPSGIPPRRCRQRRQRTVAGGRGGRAGAAAAGRLEHQRQRRLALVARWQWFAVAATGCRAGHTADPRRDPDRPGDPADQCGCRGALAAHVSGPAAQRSRCARVRVLRHRPADHRHGGRAGAPDRHARHLSQPVGVAGWPLHPERTQRAAVFVSGAGGQLPAPHPGAGPAGQTGASDRAAAIGGRPADRKRCGADRRARHRLAARCTGHAGVGRSAGRWRPGTREQGPRRGADAGRAVQPRAGHAGAIGQPIRRHPVGPRRSGDLERKLVEDPPHQAMAYRTGSTATRARTVVGPLLAGPLQGPGHAGDGGRRQGPPAAADQQRWQQPVPVRQRCFAGGRPPVRRSIRSAQQAGHAAVPFAGADLFGAAGLAGRAGHATAAQPRIAGRTGQLCRAVAGRWHRGARVDALRAPAAAIARRAEGADPLQACRRRGPHRHALAAARLRPQARRATAVADVGLPGRIQKRRHRARSPIRRTVSTRSATGGRRRFWRSAMWCSTTRACRSWAKAMPNPTTPMCRS